MKNQKQIFTSIVEGKEQKYIFNEQGQLIPLIEVKEEPSVKLAYSPDEARKILGMSRNPFMNLLTTGQLKAVKAGRKWLISSQALDNFLNPSN